MQNSGRFYLQHKLETTKFLKKLSFAQYSPITYVYSSTYTPNISEFPINFASLDSIQDYVQVKMFEDLENNHVPELNYSFITDIQNLKIVNLQGFNLATAPYSLECENNHIHNMNQYVRKSALKWLSYKIFGTKVTDHYFYQSRMHEKQLGTNQMFNNYIVELDDSFSVENHFYDVTQRLNNLGVTYFSDYQHQLLVFQDLDNLNLSRISMENSHKWRITKSEELYNLECRLSYSSSITLTPAHNQHYH